MRAEIITIGNSKGLRIPKAILEQCGLSGEVDLKVKQGQLIVKPVKKKKKLREGWAESFAKMAKVDQKLLLGDFKNSWDDEEWEW